jgi:ABC-type nitrate/sulfonate/bicarbonate transport system ATPase subunit
MTVSETVKQAGRPGIELGRIDVEFEGQHGPVTALRGISLTIAAGEFVAIVGRSGSGKSTLLRVMGGLIQHTRGSVTIDGAPVSGPPAAARFVAQDYTQSLLPWMTVEGNVRFGARHAIDNGELPRQRVDELIEMVGLAHARRRYPRELSGGMQQRVAIARALASNPGVLLLDEAFGSVDALSRATLQDMLLKLWAAYRFSAVLVTHDIEEAIFLADRVVVLGAGGDGIAEIIPIDLPRPRHQVLTRERPDYQRYRHHLLQTVLSLDELPTP